jgi:hypothetical protein
VIDCARIEQAWLTPDGTDLWATRMQVQTGAYGAFVGALSVSDFPPYHALYLLQPGTPSTILSRFAPEGWQPTSTAGQPATPQPQTSATPTFAPDTPLAGLIGEGGRPLTQAEFSSAWAADPELLAGRIVITKGPIPTGFMCWDAGAADASAPPGTCHIGVLDGTIAPEGYWAVRVGTDGRLTLIGELKMNGSLFIWSVDQVLADGSLKREDVLVVQATARPWRLDACDGPAACTYWPLLQGVTGQLVPDGAPTWEDVTGRESGSPISGLFLVRRGSDMVTILATFDLADQTG